jgi:hypothetical protein
MIRDRHINTHLLNLPLEAPACEEKGQTQKIFTTANYKVKQGRFLILSTFSRDSYTEVGPDVVDGSNEAYRIAVKLLGSGSDLESTDNYWIHEGFLIANSIDPRDCAQTLAVQSRDEADEALARFLDDLNAY